MSIISFQESKDIYLQNHVDSLHKDIQFICNQFTKAVKDGKTQFCITSLLRAPKFSRLDGCIKRILTQTLKKHGWYDVSFVVGIKKGRVVYENNHHENEYGYVEFIIKEENFVTDDQIIEKFTGLYTILNEIDEHVESVEHDEHVEHDEKLYTLEKTQKDTA